MHGYTISPISQDNQQQHQALPGPVQYRAPEGPLQVVPEAYKVQVHTTPVPLRQVRQVWQSEDEYPYAIEEDYEDAIQQEKRFYCLIGVVIVCFVTVVYSVTHRYNEMNTTGSRYKVEPETFDLSLISRKFSPTDSAEGGEVVFTTSDGRKGVIDDSSWTAIEVKIQQPQLFVNLAARWGSYIGASARWGTRTSSSFLNIFRPEWFALNWDTKEESLPFRREPCLAVLHRPKSG